MTLIERIAARFGFERPRPLPLEMIVFHNQYRARDAGFEGQRHPVHKHLIAYWPSLGVRALAGRSPLRVTIPGELVGLKTEEGLLGNILRRRQRVWGDQAVWIEL
ncbi:hypothetical protein [Sphingobium lignivorans]|uniref:Uncharacterized protein n=1 Tax=Sphingobium lignivorans TaxID=2735886 RepID=A0ABR6NFB7_9SPHN|nr:hypothetical protein [Sphingobium lignivorans]MBB5985982.1 hypothetical protein [Sphingobium lignivorans]